MRKIASYASLIVTTLVLGAAALLVSPFDPKGERVHRIARFWAAIHLRVNGVIVSLEAADNMPEPPFLLMSNHQSALDIFALLAGVPVSFKFIAKRELFRIPVFGWAMKRAGYIAIDRDNPREALKAIEESARKIKEGTTVLIFPEGHRSRDGRLQPFMKGGFSLASRAGVPVVPLAIRGSYALQPKGSILSPPRRRGRVTIRVGKPVIMEGKGLSYKAELMGEVRGRIEGLI
ncbi:MAG TPA: lysophospholipid acyltransferase family protein [Syntrophorhabdales bacterium]|nr:lysophospholipid acyltransferase family protein [Syntrophorhabdales bacterium]